VPVRIPPRFEQFFRVVIPVCDVFDAGGVPRLLEPLLEIAMAEHLASVHIRTVLFGDCCQSIVDRKGFQSVMCSVVVNLR